MASNFEMVMTTVISMGLNEKDNMYNETLFTIKGWNKQGYKVKKGEKALFTCKIWQPKTKKEMEEERQKAEEEGRKPNNSRMKLVNGIFFNRSQVEKIPPKQ